MWQARGMPPEIDEAGKHGEMRGQSSPGEESDYGETERLARGKPLYEWGLHVGGRGSRAAVERFYCLWVDISAWTSDNSIVRFVQTVRFVR